MNLLLVNPTFRKWGGVEEVLPPLAEHFLSSGDRVVLASEDTPATLAGRFPGAVVHHALPLRRTAPHTALRNAFGLARIARRERIDLISSHQTKTSVLCVAAGRLLGVPVVHTMHTWRVDWRARWFGSIGKNLVANSEATRDQLVRSFGAHREAISVIHDVPRLMPPPTAAEIARVRGEFNVSSDQPLLVCLGRLTEDKGHRVLLQAMVAVRREFPTARLLIVGKGHLRAQLEEMTASLNLADAVTLTGYREDASAILAGASIAVLPSLREAFPLTNIECLRLGVPVVTTAVDGIPELIQNGETGILVPPDNADAFAAGVCSLLRAPELGRTLAERGRKEALDRFHPAAMCERYDRYFRALVREKQYSPAAVRDGMRQSE
jgi:glycosyltransferase involved in cell wall biosynthesis